jgi:hypothetical protein
MLTLLRSMAKEEWRIHSTLFGNLLFLLFPFVIMLAVIVTCAYSPLMQGFVTLGTIVAVVNFLFLFFGMNIGAFGMHALEFMNRRFGHASLIAYSSRSLPVSEHEIFINMLVKDVFYYFMLFIVPSVAGFSIIGSFFGMTISQAMLMLVSVTLSFLIGMSVVFFLSVVYSHSARLLALMALLFGVAVAMWSRQYGLVQGFPPIAFFYSASWVQLLISLAITSGLCAFSTAFLKVDYPGEKEAFRNRLESRAKSLRRFFPARMALLVSKDFLDLKRSRGGIGRIIFSLLVPMILIWLFLNSLAGYVRIMDVLGVFSIVLATYTSSIYNWLTEYDAFTHYAFLPVKASEVIMAKVRVTLVTSLVSVAIFLAVGLKQGLGVGMIPCFAAFCCLFIYGLSLTVYLTGLYPSILFFSAKNLVLYLVYLVPPSVLLILATFFNQYYLFMSLLLLPVAWYFLQSGLNRWDSREQLTF